MVNSQINLFFIFLINGVIIGVLFDIFRILRKSFKTGLIITSIEDIIFWILTGFIILYTIFMFNNGVIRGYMFIAILCGVIIYIITLSKYFVSFNTCILNFIKKIVIQLIRIINFPLKIAINFANFAKKHIIKKDFFKKCRK